MKPEKKHCLIPHPPSLPLSPSPPPPQMTESEEAELKGNPATFFFNQAYTFSNTSFFDIPEGGLE